MSTPVHVVHTIHGTFSGMSTYSNRSYAGAVMDMPDRQAPGLVKAAWRVVPVPIPPSCRRLSPPKSSSRAATAQPVHFPREDPFDDRYALPSSPVQNQQLVPYQRTRLASQSLTVKLPRPSQLDALVRQRTAQRLAQDREARCKAVAGILLNRVHAVGKPMRRLPPRPDAPREYKRSRLSTMMTVDDL